MSTLRREYECVAESADGIGHNHGAALSLERTFGGRPRRSAAAPVADSVCALGFLKSLRDIAVDRRGNDLA